MSSREAFSQLTERIKSFENWLQHQPFKTVAAVPFSIKPPLFNEVLECAEKPAHKVLQFERSKQAWKLVVYSPQFQNPCLLQDCTIPVKIAAVSQFATLISCMKLRYDLLQAEAIKATQLLDTIFPQEPHEPHPR